MNDATNFFRSPGFSPLRVLSFVLARMKVLKGYTGDRSANVEWISSAMTIANHKDFDMLGKQGARPLELATLRLQNMQQILTKWNQLSPPNKELITQQGGTVVFDGKEAIYSFKDKV